MILIGDLNYLDLNLQPWHDIFVFDITDDMTPLKIHEDFHGQISMVDCAEKDLLS